jgi:hypothetical protein
LLVRNIVGRDRTALLAMKISGLVSTAVHLVGATA